MNQGDTGSSVNIAAIVTGGALCAIALFSVYGDLTNPAPPATPEALVQNQPPAALPVVAPAPAVVDTGKESRLELLTLLADWQEAWASGDVDRYLSFYAEGFKGSAASAEQWQANRRRIIGQAGKIDIKLGEAAISIEGDNNALLTFPMIYRSSRLNDEGTKQLQLVRENGQWRIVQELFTTN